MQHLSEQPGKDELVPLVYFINVDGALRVHIKEVVSGDYIVATAHTCNMSFRNSGVSHELLMIYIITDQSAVDEKDYRKMKTHDVEIWYLQTLHNSNIPDFMRSDLCNRIVSMRLDLNKPRDTRDSIKRAVDCILSRTNAGPTDENSYYVVLAAGESAYEYGYVVDMVSELPKGYTDEIERGNLIVYAKFTGPGDSPKQAAATFCDMLVVKNRGCGVMINGNVNRFCLRFLAHMIKSSYLQQKDEAADLLADLCCLDLDRVGISYEQRLAISRLCTVNV